MPARLQRHRESQLVLQKLVDVALMKESSAEGEVVERQDPLLNGLRQSLERHVHLHLIADLLKANGWRVMRPQVHVSDRDEPNVQNEADECEHDANHHLSGGGGREFRERDFSLCVLQQRLTSTWLFSSMLLANSVMV